MSADLQGHGLNATVALNTGARMPQFGLGVFRAGEDTTDAVLTALEHGYRHLDTAAIYRNEEGVGKGLAQSGLAREDVFITTKLWNADQGYEGALSAIDASLDRLGLDYVDLYLIHWPVPDGRRESWRAMEKMFADGRCRAIGVSNFMTQHLEEFFANSEVVPAANQIELHPWLIGSRTPTIELCAARDIRVVAYSPLTKGKKLGDPALGAIAADVGKTPAQVLIRWGLQKGFLMIPKSANPGRIVENAAVFDWALDAAAMSALDSLDSGLAVAWDPIDAP